MTTSSENSLTARAGWGASEAAGELTLHAAVACWTWTWSLLELELELELEMELELEQLFPWTQALCTVILVGGGRKASPGCDGASILVVWLLARCCYLAATVLGAET